MHRLLWNVRIVSKSKTVQDMLEAISRKLKLSKVHLYFNLRDIQRVCVKKVSSVPAAAVSSDIEADGAKQRLAETV